MNFLLSSISGFKSARQNPILGKEIRKFDLV